MLYHFTRVHKVEGKPLALMETWVRDDITEFGREALANQGLYAILRHGGVNYRLANQQIGALVTMERTAVDDTGRQVETGHHVYRADHHSFEVTLVQH